jgi:hypothetical protein
MMWWRETNVHEAVGMEEDEGGIGKKKENCKQERDVGKERGNMLLPQLAFAGMCDSSNPALATMMRDGSLKREGMRYRRDRFATPLI